MRRPAERPPGAMVALLGFGLAAMALPRGARRKPLVA